MKFTFENYVSLAKLDKDAKAEDYSSEVDKLNEMDFAELFSNYGSDAIGMRTVVDLKEELKRYDLSTAGRKQDLVDRLSEYFESSKKRKADDAADSEEKKQKVDFEGKNPGNVIGGYKAAAHNPNLPEESREKAEQVLEEMGIDADEKVESTAKLSDGSVGNPGNVAGGFKATLHNPNASEDAKEHAQEMLDKMGVDAEEKAPKKDDDRAKDEGHVIGGYRATLSNPNTSQEAKDNARKALEEMGVDPDERVQTKADYSSTDVDLEGKDKSHVIAGFKATLSNDASSEEAKDHARKVLKEMGVDPEERLQSKPDYSSTEVDLEGKDKSHVIAGFKATLSNDASSEEAKDHARKVLEEMGVDPEERVKTDYSSTEVDLEGKDKSHVIAGFKATLSNDASSEEAKAHALKVLKEMGVDPNDRAVDHRGSEFSGQYTADGKNLGNVVGGYKATLSNPNASEEAKEGARDALAEIQKSQ